MVKSYEERKAEMRAYAEMIPVGQRAARYQALYQHMSVHECVELGLLPPGATSMGDWYMLLSVLADLLGSPYIAADARVAMIELGAGVDELTQNGL